MKLSALTPPKHASTAFWLALLTGLILFGFTTLSGRRSVRLVEIIPSATAGVVLVAVDSCDGNPELAAMEVGDDGKLYIEVKADRRNGLECLDTVEVRLPDRPISAIVDKSNGSEIELE